MNHWLCACALKRTGLSRRCTTTTDHARPRTTDLARPRTTTNDDSRPRTTDHARPRTTTSRDDAINAATTHDHARPTTHDHARMEGQCDCTNLQREWEHSGLWELYRHEDDISYFEDLVKNNRQKSSSVLCRAGMMQ